MIEIVHEPWSKSRWFLIDLKEIIIIQNKQSTIKWATKSLIFNALTTNYAFKAIKLRRDLMCKIFRLSFLSLPNQKVTLFWSLLFLLLLILVLVLLFLFLFLLTLMSHFSVFNKWIIKFWNEEKVTYLTENRERHKNEPNAKEITRKGHRKLFWN